MLTDLRIARQNLLALYVDQVAKPEAVYEKLNAYLELLIGMADCDSDDNKLRYTFRFKWSDSLVQGMDFFVCLFSLDIIFVLMRLLWSIIYRGYNLSYNN